MRGIERDVPGGIMPWIKCGDGPFRRAAKRALPPPREVPHEVDETEGIGTILGLILCSHFWGASGNFGDSGFSSRALTSLT